MNKLISVCMTTYNGENYLKEQIESILAQDYQNFELIIQDDNSTDNTLKILKQYESRENIFVYYNQTNLGYIKNFESILQKSKGEYIALCDQDDIWQKDKLSKLAENIGDTTLIYADSLLIDSNGIPLNRTLSQKLKNNFISSKEPLNFLYDNSVSAHAALFKRELREHLKQLPVHLYFDQYIACVAASLHGVSYLNETLVHYRQHSDNTLSQNKKNKMTFFQRIANKLQKKVQNNQIMLEKIIEMQKITTLQEKDKKILERLQSINTHFFQCYYNLPAAYFFLQHKNLFFAITQKNPTLLSLKKAIGFKLYKVLPIL